MDPVTKQFIIKYNQYAIDNEMHQFSVTAVEKRLTEVYGYDRINVYDKIEQLYPPIRKYILDEMCKIYCSGNQLCVTNDTVCSVCNESFRISCAATYKNEELMHVCCAKTSNTDVKENVKEMLNEDNICKICEEPCTDLCVFIDSESKFCHRICCIDKAKEAYAGHFCAICEEEIVAKRNTIEICIRDDYEYCSDCAKRTHKSLQFKKIKVNLVLNKCGICGFYILDKKIKHAFCENKLKNV